jgi:hypothetical protein
MDQYLDINMVGRSAKVVQPLRSPEAHSGKFVKGHGFETCSLLRAKSVQSLIRVFVTLRLTSLTSERFVVSIIAESNFHIMSL